MNWFQHDTDSTQDAKLKKLLIRQGAIGYAVYFHCLELIASDISESNLTFELEHDSEIIASNLFIKGTADKSGIEIVESVMRDIIDIGLFSESNGRVFCIKLLKRISLSMTSNPSFRTAINSKKEEYHDSVMIHHDSVMTRHETLPTLPTNSTYKQERESKTSSPINNGSSRIGQAQAIWNAKDLKPASRIMTIQFKPDDLSTCLATVQAYTDEEIEQAIENYAKILVSPDHDIGFKYGSFQGFMRAGVEKFINDSDPWTQYKKQEGNKPAEAGYKFDPKDYKDI